MSIWILDEPIETECYNCTEKIVCRVFDTDIEGNLCLLCGLKEVSDQIKELCETKAKLEALQVD